MKEYKKMSFPRMVLSKATCDRCGGDCTNSHMDIQLKYSFSDKPELIETLCWKCYEKNYHKQIIELRDKKFKDSLVGKAE